LKSGTFASEHTVSITGKDTNNNAYNVSKNNWLAKIKWASNYVHSGRLSWLYKTYKILRT